MKTRNVWFALAAIILVASVLAWRVKAQSIGDDLAVALANHGMDVTTAPIAAAAIEIAIANDNKLLDRIAVDEAATVALQTRVAAVEAKLAPPPLPASTFALSVSLSADRSGAASLNGATLKGSVYIFTSLAVNLQNASPAGITSVCYWLDNPAATGTASHCESGSPYDFQGGTVAAALAWTSSSVPNGQHTLTQKIASGEIDTATFTVAN